MALKLRVLERFLLRLPVIPPMKEVVGTLLIQPDETVKKSFGCLHDIEGIAVSFIKGRCCNMASKLS